MRRENSPRTVSLADAQRVVEGLRNALAHVAEPVVASGSVRRELPLVGDVDVIAVGDFAAIAQALEPFNIIPQTERPWVLSGEYGGVGFDVVTAAAHSFGAAQAMVTGPAAYRTFLENHARTLGLDFSSAGLRESVSGELLPTPTEESLFVRLGLPVVPPAERESLDG